MTADATDPLSLLRSIVLGQFPWLALVRKATDGGLSFKVAANLLHLAGDALDPAAARVGDLVVRLYLYTPSMLPPVLYASRSVASPYTWTAVLTSSVLPPTITEPGTELRIVEGSGKVTIA